MTADPNHQETAMTDLDLSDLLDPALPADHVDAELRARLRLPACEELWDRAEFAAMQAALLQLADEQDRIVHAMLAELVSVHEL